MGIQRFLFFNTSPILSRVRGISSFSFSFLLFRCVAAVPTPDVFDAAAAKVRCPPPQFPDPSTGRVQGLYRAAARTLSYTICPFRRAGRVLGPIVHAPPVFAISPPLLLLRHVPAKKEYGSRDPFLTGSQSGSDACPA